MAPSPEPQRDASVPTPSSDPKSADERLSCIRIQLERKHITLDLRENQRGRFLRITEEVAGRYNAVVVPATGLLDFRQALDTIITAANALPAQTPAPEPVVPPKPIRPFGHKRPPDAAAEPDSPKES